MMGQTTHGEQHTLWLKQKGREGEKQREKESKEGNEKKNKDKKGERNIQYQYLDKPIEHNQKSGK